MLLSEKYLLPFILNGFHRTISHRLVRSTIRSFLGRSIWTTLANHGNKIQNWVITSDLRSVYLKYSISQNKFREKYWIKIILKKFSNVDFDANKWNCRLPVGERSVRKEIIRNQECYGFIFFDWYTFIRRLYKKLRIIAYN